MTKKSSRSKNRKGSTSPMPPKRQRMNKKWFLKKINLLWTAITIIALFLGLPRAVSYFYPNVSIVPSHIVDPNDPLKDTFFMNNDGNFSIYDDSISCDVTNAEYEHHNNFGNIILTNETFIKEIPSHSGETIQIPSYLSY
jgi:hypothetical protein